MWVRAARYDLFSFAVFLPYFSMLILSLPLLWMGSKSTSVGPGFCVHRPRQHDTISWELNLISGFFVFFFWVFVWADGINKYGWCLAGGRGCWLKGLHQVPSVSWIFHHSLHFHIDQIVPFVPGILCPFYSYYKWWGDGTGRGWLIHMTVWVGWQGLGIICLFFFLLVLLSFSVSYTVSFLIE